MAHDVDLTPDIYFAAEITKFENQPDGSVMVYGCPVKPETLDNDDQIADAGWLQEALPAWFHSYGNVREMHQPSAVGAAKSLEWKNEEPQISAKVVDPIAANKVREGVYKAFSMGVKKPELVYDREAPGGRIKGGKIVEVSLVDRPSIPGSDIASFKAAVADGLMLCKAVGVNEWFDTQMGVVIADDMLDRTSTSGGDMTDKAASPDDGKAVEAEAVKEADPDMNAEETAKAADVEKVDDEKAAVTDSEKAADLEESAEADEPKSALAQLEKTLADKTWCAQCGSMQKIDGGTTEKVGSVEMLVGKDAAGHALRKVIGTKSAAVDAEKSDDVEKSDEAEKSVEVAIDKSDTEKAADAEKDAAPDENDDAFGDASGPEKKTADADAAKALAAAVEKTDGDTLKSALVDLFKEAGIDLGKVGRKMATKRLDRFNAAIDELKSLASELTDGVMPDGEKAADAGGPVQVDGSTALAETRFIDALRIVNALARELHPGDGTFDLDAAGKDGHEMGVAEALQIKDRIDTNNGKAADPDLTKAEIISETTKLLGPELAKSFAAHLETAFGPLVQRLEKVEHTVVPAAAPVLREADRRHAFDDGDLEKQARSEEALKADLAKRLDGLSDQDREALLATMVAAGRGWR